MAEQTIYNNFAEYFCTRLRSNIFLLKTMCNEILVFNATHDLWHAMTPYQHFRMLIAHACIRKDYGYKKAMSHVVAWRARQFPRPIIIRQWAATPAASRAAPPRAFLASQTEAMRINILTPGGALFSLNRARAASPRIAIITGVAVTAVHLHTSRPARADGRTNEANERSGASGDNG